MGLDTVELVLETEKHFDITFADSELENIETVELFCKLIKHKLLIRQGFKAPSNTEIQKTIINFLVSDYGVNRDKVFPGSRFVKDLGLV